MSNDDDSNTLQRTVNYQRRSVSVGDSPLQMVADDEPQPCTNEEIKDYNQYITTCDGDGYICAPLPRCNNRPTAKTCWLVLCFHPHITSFPYLDKCCTH